MKATRQRASVLVLFYENVRALKLFGKERIAGANVALIRKVLSIRKLMWNTNLGDNPKRYKNVYRNITQIVQISET